VVQKANCEDQQPTMKLMSAQTIEEAIQVLNCQELHLHEDAEKSN
jgi:hypothetical protein